MWAQEVISNINITSKTGNICNSAQQTITFPKTSLTNFINIEVTFASNSGAFASVSTGGNRKNNVGFWLYASAAVTGVSGMVYAHAIGTWK